MPTLIIDDGIKRYDITDTEGRPLGTIAFNPNDINFLKRVREIEPKLNEIMQSVVTLAESSEVSDEEKEAKIIALDEEAKQSINDLFDADVSSVVFKNQHCFNTSSGVMFLERFMNMITPVIEAETKEEQKASEQRKKKYTGKYKK